MSSTLKLQTTPVFTRNLNSTKKIVINRGGTRSSKTVSICQLCLMWLMTGNVTKTLTIPKGVWSTVRKFSTSLDSSVIRDFEEEIDKHNYRGSISINKTKKTYQHGERIVEFLGADDEQKLRGTKRNILYCNEANELAFNNEFFQLLIRTEDKVFIDFNPDDENIWINTELEQKRMFDKGDVEVIVSTYKDNTFLNQSLIEEIEYMKGNDPEFWNIYGLGLYGKISGLIYPEPTIISEMPKEATLIGYGMDFGFTNDPTTVIKVCKQNGELFFEELIYDTRLTNQMIAIRLRELQVDTRAIIIADSAEPKSIEEIYNERFNIKPALKGKDSINNGIDILKRYKWNITANSVNLIKERRSYRWATDKDNHNINIPVDRNNHALDAIRYVALNLLATNNSGSYAIR